ncbi:MAG: hypothetical protein IT436_13660 [Phycisphaerales bacterium]|nr:hypothetical protein [Phycisphaerales bacterium]
MRHNQIKPGGTYGVRIKGRLTPVLIEAGHYQKREFLGWTATVVATGEGVTIDPWVRLSRLPAAKKTTRRRS